MWSVAYGLIAFAVVAFVVLYTALHTPSVASVNLADQLYHAKKRLADNLTSLPRTERDFHFAIATNIVRVKTADVSASGRTFTVQLPIGYKLSARERNILYEAYFLATHCRLVTLQGGKPATLYVVELKHSLDVLPQLSVYAAVPRDAARYYEWLYNHAPRRPPAVGLDPRVGADADAGLVDYVKAEWALVYDTASGTAVLYAAAPTSSLYLVVEDYPLKIPLACP